MAAKKKVEDVSGVSNDAAEVFSDQTPYAVEATIVGTSRMLFHRFSCDEVEAKGSAAKGSRSKKKDNVESYVYRDEKSQVSLPGEYVRQAIIHAAKYKQDPRSPRKSMMDMAKAGFVCLTELAPIGKEWEYIDRRRAVIQRAAIVRERPGFREGWKATFIFEILLPEYIDEKLFHELLVNAGRLIGVGDFRPTFGRFRIESFRRLSLEAAAE
jgi:hypothetical protein